MFKFSANELFPRREEEVPLQATEGAAVRHAAVFSIPKEKRFTSMGGWPVVFRASIVRVNCALNSCIPRYVADACLARRSWPS